MIAYNPWPLGDLPIEYRRTELEEIRSLGYEWSDAREIVHLFETKIAQYAGSKFAVATDCASNAIFLCLKYRRACGYASIPNNTYISVPMQLIHAGLKIDFRFETWSGVYEIAPWNIIDSAARFTENMYEGNGKLQVLSFQIKKRLPIGRGGMILTDSEDAYRWLKLSSYDGRDLSTPYDDRSHVKQLGWHFYMTPEDAARGLLLFNKIALQSPDSMTWQNYPDLTQVPVIHEHVRSRDDAK